MRSTSLIQNIKSIEWELNIQEAYLFSWIYELPSWADHTTLGNDVFYFCAKNKVVDELPLLSSKIDTIYRHMKKLSEKGLIRLIKVDNRDYINITKKGMLWNKHENLKNDGLGKKSEYSEELPNDLGKKSEDSSEKNPTDIYTIYNNYTSYIQEFYKKNSKDKRMHNFFVEIFDFLHKDLLGMKYKFAPKDFPHIHPLVDSVYERLCEVSMTKEITVKDVMQGVEYFIRASISLRDGYFLKSFNIPILRSQSRDIFLRLSEKKKNNGQPKQTATQQAKSRSREYAKQNSHYNQR